MVLLGRGRPQLLLLDQESRVALTQLVRRLVVRDYAWFALQVLEKICFRILTYRGFFYGLFRFLRQCFRREGDLLW